MLVLVKGSAESVSSTYLQMSDLCWFVDRLGEWAERSGLAQGPVWSMAVVEGLELAERVEEVANSSRSRCGPGVRAGRSVSSAP
jgi:hypothetical protein